MKHLKIKNSFKEEIKSILGLDTISKHKNNPDSSLSNFIQYVNTDNFNK